MPSTSEILEIIRADVRTRGLSQVARTLGIHRQTLANALAGAARAGTLALVEQRFRALAPAVQP